MRSLRFALLIGGLSLCALPALAQNAAPVSPAGSPAVRMPAPAAAPADTGMNISRSFAEPVNAKQNENQAVERIYLRIAAECESAAKAFKKKCVPANISVNSQPAGTGPDGKPVEGQVTGSVTLNLR